MPIECKIDWDKIKAQCNNNIEQIKSALFDVFAYVGEEAVKTARIVGNYNNPTGNLRSSINYNVLYDGEVVRGGNPEVFQGENGGTGDKGVTASQELLSKLATQYNKGLVLIVVAGMQYAVYVEDFYKKDVLTTARLKANDLAKKMIDEVTK